MLNKPRILTVHFTRKVVKKKTASKLIQEERLVQRGYFDYKYKFLLDSFVDLQLNKTTYLSKRRSRFSPALLTAS